MTTDRPAEALAAWVGHSEQSDDVITSTPLEALAATLDRGDPPPATGDPLPPLGHWLYFLPLHRRSQLGPDGHARRGGFLPQVTLPLRMWAGGTLDFLAPLRVGDAVTRRSTIEAVTPRQGRTGPLVFVQVRHAIAGPAGPALVEVQELVYRDRPAPGQPPPPPRPAPPGAAFERRVDPDEVLLFRYSALTFNGHRIHYDRRFAVEVEGYPGLVMHGPLLATLLCDLACEQRPAARLTRFAFRAVAPLFDTAPFFVCGRPPDDGDPGALRLWARSAEGHLAMEASATFAPPSPADRQGP